MKQGRMKVMLGIPTMTNRVTIQVAGLMDALRFSSQDPQSDFDIHFTIEHGRAPVEYARNVIVGTFLRSDCDKLWFLDEDMLPQSSVARLIHNDADIVSARMYKFDHPSEKISVGLGLCAMKRTSRNLYEPFVPQPGTPAVQEVDAVGTACTVIHRRVLEDRRLWFDNTYTTVEGKVVNGNEDNGTDEFAPAIFRYVRAPNGCGLMGEDVDFCERAKALGYTIKADLNAVCGHYKSIDIDQAGFLAQEAMKRAIRGVQLDDGRVLKYTVQHKDEAVA